MAMTFDEFHARMQRIGLSMDDLGKEVETTAMDFVDGNFTAQGWEGVPWKPSEGTILVKSGTLRSGFRSSTVGGVVSIRNDVPYAKTHNEGFRGTVDVKAHKRARMVKKRGKSKVTGLVDVRAHTRNMNMPRRQFAPYDGHPSPTLNARVMATIDDFVKRVLNQLKK